MTSGSELNYYEMLGVSPDATYDEIKAAWKKCAGEFHPDVNPRGTSFRFRKAKDACEVLLDPEKRRQYDAFLKDGRHQTRSNFRSRTNRAGCTGTSYIPDTVIDRATENQIVDLIKTAVSAARFKKLRVRSGDRTLWEINITVATAAEILGWVYFPMATLLTSLGVGHIFEIEMVDEIFETYNLGVAAQSRGDLDGAKVFYKQCIASDEHCAPAHLNLGTIYHDQGSLSAAEKCYQNAIYSDPDGEAGKLAQTNLENMRRGA